MEKTTTPARRENWWTEDATETLVEAWGNRCLKLNWRNLRRNDWEEIAGAVNSRHCNNNGRPKTDAQCKNRMDTMKKKYKSEKSKLSPSTWRFFDRLDVLIGPVLKKSEITNPNFNLTGSKYTGNSDDEEGLVFRDLAMAIVRFGEVYERIESRKQRMVMEMEKQRMEVVKEVELQGMNMLMEMQLDMEKSKQHHGSGKKL